MKERIRLAFNEMAREYDALLKDFYPGKRQWGFNESNQIRMFLGAYEKLYGNSVTWQELSAGVKNQRIDGFVWDRDINGILYIEAKRLNSQTKLEEMVNDYNRLCNKAFRESLLCMSPGGCPMASGIVDCSEHILLLCDIWDECSEAPLREWIADWGKTTFDGQSTGGNPILERIGPIPSGNVTVMRSEPIMPMTSASSSAYYLAGLSVVIK